jgi:hypothetical protein
MLSFMSVERAATADIGLLEYLLGDDPSWYVASGKEVGLDPGKVYDSRSMDWNFRMVNQLTGILVENGLVYQKPFYPVSDGYQPGATAEALQKKPAGFVVIDPGPKAIGDLRGKLQLDGVADYSLVFDFLRATIVGSTPDVCVRIEELITVNAGPDKFFAPMSDAERTLTTGRVIPAITPFGNEQSAPELLEMVGSGRDYAKTMRFKIGGETRGKEFYHLSSDPQRVLRRNPLPGLRASVVVMTPGIFEFLHNPLSPAHHDNYAQRKNATRRLK